VIDTRGEGINEKIPEVFNINEKVPDMLITNGKGPDAEHQ
jgi:hypothetical protein